MPDPGTVPMVPRDGGPAIDVPADKVGYYLAQHYQIPTDSQRVAQVGQQTRESQIGAVDTLGQGIARGVTIGASDVGQRLIGGDVAAQYLREQQAARPGLSTAGQIIGAVAPALVGDESSLAGLAERTPAGFTAGIGAKIADSLGGATGLAARGAFEGAAMNAGQYVSDVALGNRDLSAEGFLGAMGQGALYGGVSAGALSLAHNGLIAARRLIPLAEQTPEAIAEAQTAASNGIRDSVETSAGLEATGQQQASNAQREAEQFAADLEAERAQAAAKAQQAQTSALRDQIKAKIAAGQVEGETGPFTPDGLELATDRELARQTGQPLPKNAEQMLREWRSKYPAGAVDYDAASAAARKGRLADWAKNFEPQTPEDETIKAYFENPQDPMRTQERIGGMDVPPEVKKAASSAANDASRAAYLDATAQAANVSHSGTELMARSIYSARRAAAIAMDDVYAAYRSGMPIADIQQAVSKRLMGDLHELAASRQDMIHALAKKPALQVAESPQSLGERILQGATKQQGPDDVIAGALGKTNDVNADIADVAPKITRYEAAKAKVAESLGDKASPDAIAHAQAFRAAQQHAQEASSAGIAQATDNVDKLNRGIPSDKLAGGQGLLGGLAKKASGYGQTYQLLRSFGMPLPSLHGIPVIGPLLSLYLKAKILSKIAGKFGGSFAETAEGTIAAKAAATQNRINRAVDTMLDVSSKVTGKAATLVGPMVLAHKLFDDGTRQPYSSAPKPGSLPDMYHARMSELAAAMKPGAVEQAVKSRINTSDPTIVNSIIAAETNKLQYLYSVAPKPAAPPLPGEPPWTPSRAELDDFGIVLAAAHDPAAIFEKVAKGVPARPAEIDCVKNCYPQLYAAAQKQLVSKYSKLQKPLPWPRRVAISMLTDIPMDRSMMPDRAASLQGGFSAPMATQPQPMPSPTLSSSINLGQQTLTRLDR